MFLNLCSSDEQQVSSILFTTTTKFFMPQEKRIRACSIVKLDFSKPASNSSIRPEVTNTPISAYAVAQIMDYM